MNDKDEIDPTIDFILSAYKAILDIKIENLMTIGVDVPIPSFSPTHLMSLCIKSIQHFQEQPSLIEIQGPIIVVGDLHGSLHDAIRIFSMFGQPPKQKYLFLGDYVDRGPYSLEVMTMLLAFFCAYPEHIFLIRGNHEFRPVNAQYGFKMEIIMAYGSGDIWESFQNVFDWLPIAAVIGDELFCVHGGLSPMLSTIDVIKEIVRPVSDTSNQLIMDMLWSDPSDNYLEFSESKRGTGITYGQVAIKNFLAKNKFKWIIRAHQYVEEGVSIFPQGPVVTVFSSSCYGVCRQNKSGILRISETNNLEPICLPALTKLRREVACFYLMTQNRVSLERMSPPSSLSCPFKPNIMQTVKIGNRSMTRIIPFGKIRSPINTVPQNTFSNS